MITKRVMIPFLLEQFHNKALAGVRIWLSVTTSIRVLHNRPMLMKEQCKFITTLCLFFNYMGQVSSDVS